ncbi:MAG: hypothetical protein HW412_2640 [Bacteroidetes bacterium]|nr:hypothetical protein [Bacteroidota bacterium]
MRGESQERQGTPSMYNTHERKSIRVGLTTKGPGLTRTAILFYVDLVTAES